MIREDNENFFLDLTTRPGEMLPRVTINPDVAEVTINEDGESSSVVFPSCILELERMCIYSFKKSFL